MAVLIELRGDQRREFRLAQSNTLGRGATASIQVSDPLVSREHARIDRTEKGDYELFDLDSRYGTFMGQERVHRRLLADGDEFIIGATRLLFQRDFETMRGRRWYERVPCDLEVTAMLPDGERVDTRANNMSVGGMRLMLERSLDIDTEIELSVAFPNRWRRVKCRVRVADPGSPDQGVGVVFVFTSDQTQLSLAQEFARLLRADKAEE